MKVVLGMSGGGDSSGSAALLLTQGYEVIGITMKLRDEVSPDAQSIAEHLGISHYVMDLSSEFKKKIVDYFISEYSIGRTPNPCVRCNEYIKFEALLKKASELGADFIATGHYAKIEPNGKKYILKKGNALKKEQSYFLARLPQRILSKTLFPLGDYTKVQVIEIAKELGLTVTKPESQEICFIPNSNYTKFLHERIPSKDGNIVNKNGKILGRHTGIWSYTIGQRKRIGKPRDKPFYVTHINANDKTVIVGDEEDLYSNRLVADNLNFLSDLNEKTFETQVKIRYQHNPACANLTLQDNGKALVKFKEPQRAITPGQLAVFYQEDIVLGSGWIK